LISPGENEAHTSKIDLPKMLRQAIKSQFPKLDSSKRVPHFGIEWYKEFCISFQSSKELRRIVFDEIMSKLFWVAKIRVQ